MKFGGDSPELDAIDLQIINLLQEHGRIPLVKLGEQVGLSAPSVNERVKKLEDGGVIIGYEDVSAHRQPPPKRPRGAPFLAYFSLTLRPSRSAYIGIRTLKIVRRGCDSHSIVPP